MVVVAESPDLEDTKTFVRRLGEELQADTAHVQEVFYRIDTSPLEGKKLLFLSLADLRTLRENVEYAGETVLLACVPQRPLADVQDALRMGFIINDQYALSCHRSRHS